MKFCVECEKESVVFGKTTIKIGEKDFPLETEYCTKCDAVHLSPKDQEKIDIWGSELTTAVKESQPYLPEQALILSDVYAKAFGLKWTEFVKVCTTFYIFEMTKDKKFKEARESLLAEAQQIFVTNSKASKIKKSIPVRYRLFKQMQLFAEVWDIHEANVIEEAVLCCTALLESHKAQGIAEKKALLQSYVERFATAS